MNANGEKIVKKDGENILPVDEALAESAMTSGC
jgi:hypothetical protein